MVQAWTIPKDERDHIKMRRSDSPGPGDYKKVNLNLVRYAAPEWTIKGKYPHKLVSNANPGPGTYSLYMNRPGSAYTIQGKQRLNLTEDGPGPGQYSVWSERDHIGGYMGIKDKTKHKEGSPGPAAYSLQNMRMSHDGWMFPKAIKDNFRILDFPGPGAYDNLKKSRAPLGIIGNAKRTEARTCYESPGPGSYASRTTFGKNGWTIQGKPRYSDIFGDFVPGPGTYFPNIRGSSPSYTIGVRPNDRVRASDSPGPNVYFPSVHPVKPRPQSTKFPKSKREEKYPDMPGPGTYSYKSAIGGQGFAIGRRLPTPRKSEYGPGPGAYKIIGHPTKPRPKSAKIGRSQRMEKHIDSTPGPGYYGYGSKKDKKYGKFGKSERKGPAKATNTPGPGAYKL